MKKCLFCALALLAAEYCLADAPRGFYSGAAISQWQYDQPAPATNADVTSLELNAGFWFHPLLSAEVRVGTGIGDRDTTVDGTAWELAIDNFGSIYWRPEVGNRAAKLYGLLGYSHVRVAADTMGNGNPQSIELSEGGKSFGAGIGFFYDEHVTLNLEWKQLVDTDGFEISGYTAGFDYRF